MKKSLIIGLVACTLSTTTLAHVCNSIRQIQGFSSSTLFDKAIINGKPIDYLVFKSSCNIACLLNNFNRQQFQYGLSANNLSVFNNSSVATLTIESIDKNIVSGYLTCSSTAKRVYLPLPVAIKQNKVVMDLQTEDSRTISRSITLSNYSQQDYIVLMKSLTAKSTKTVREVSFVNYYVKSNGINYVVKISAFNKGGNFMLILERSK